MMAQLRARDEQDQITRHENPPSEEDEEIGLYRNMNTGRSTWIGWISLCLAGGGAYVVAKRGVNADRAARHAEDMKRWRIKDDVEAEYASRQPSTKPRKMPKTTPAIPISSTSESSTETGTPPARDREKDETVNKYIAAKPFRSTKGDRFS